MSEGLNLVYQCRSVSGPQEPAAELRDLTLLRAVGAPQCVGAHPSRKLVHVAAQTWVLLLALLPA